MTKKLQVGRRYTACCCQDAGRIEDSTTLEELLELNAECFEEDGIVFYTFYPTKEELIEKECSCGGACKYL